MVGGHVDHIHRRDLYSAARASRRNCLKPYDAGLSEVAETLVGILKRVIVTPAVYPRFLHVDIQSTGHTLSQAWSRQPNDFISEIEYAQLHNELLGRRHSTRQSHGLFALSKHLLQTTAINQSVQRNSCNGEVGYVTKFYGRHKLNKYHFFEINDN